MLSHDNKLITFKKEVLFQNLRLNQAGLVVLTWGNVSGLFDYNGAPVIVIKPSGVPYDKMTYNDMAVVSLDGSIIDGPLRPSTDLPTHLFLYRFDHRIRGIGHTHSTYATAWAQAERAIPNLGTTHSDFALGAVPCTRPMTPEEISSDYEENTGKVIAETLCRCPEQRPQAILVDRHGPFAWGGSSREAVDNLITLEKIAEIAAITFSIRPDCLPIDGLPIAKKHFERKHGPLAYYGQKK